MKKTYILFAFLFTLIGCTEILEETTELGEDCIVLNVYNGPMVTKATNAGAEYERQIKRLDCFFYVKDALDKCVYYQKVENTEAKIGSQEIPFYVDESIIDAIFPGNNTTCDVVVIANYPDTDDWETTYSNTSVESLKNIVLNLFEKETDGTYKHDAADKPFVMYGFKQATKGDNKNAAGTIPLVRAASKITMRVKMPEWIEVTEIAGDSSADGTTTTLTEVRYYPHLDNDSDGKLPLRTAFHNGVCKTYLNNDYNDQLADGDYTKGGDYFSTGMTAYKDLIFTDGADDETPGYYTCDIEVPFYSYARTWAKGANNAPYLALQMPWKKIVDGEDVIDTYYYQILVNAGGLTLNPNTWYDLIVNVGVLGSLTESVPTEIKSDDITYYILDWTKEPSQSEGDRYEDIVIKEYAYLMVPEDRIIINNSNVGYIPYDSSHPVTISMDGSSKTDEILKTTTSASAFYIDGLNIRVQAINNINTSNFNTTEKPGYVTYRYNIPDNVYSPVFVYITISMTVGDRTFSEKVTIVQYPPMYIIPDWSTLRSVYVNGDRASYTSNGLEPTDIDNYPLGYINGVQNFSNNNHKKNNPMYVINVTSFTKDNVFDAPALDNSGYFVGVKTGTYNGGSHTPAAQPETTEYSYIIGDPRVTTPDNNLGGDLEDSWTTARALIKEDGSEVEENENYTRKLKYYYPAGGEGESFRVVAPKFRIVSFNNASGKVCTHLSAAMRCASVQEDGFPAGRWRLPTVAEIQYIIMLQEEGAIQAIFTSGSSYYATSSYSDTNHSKRIALSYRDGKVSWNSLNANISVRCVYDEWYWGSERDAIINPNSSQNTPGDNDTDKNSKYGDKYLFTWGDKPMQ